MLYLVECNFLDGLREAEWNAWYDGHLAGLLAIPGITSAQRFRALGDGFPTYRALYAVASPAVFTSDAYRNRSFGHFPDAWHDSVADWRRNVFDGVTGPPAVGPDGCVVLATPESAPEGVRLDWIDAVALDRSVPRLGIGTVTRADGQRLAARLISGLTVAVPLTPYLTPQVASSGSAR